MIADSETKPKKYRKRHRQAESNQNSGMQEGSLGKPPVSATGVKKSTKAESFEDESNSYSENPGHALLDIEGAELVNPETEDREKEDTQQMFSDKASSHGDSEEFQLGPKDLDSGKGGFLNEAGMQLMPRFQFFITESSSENSNA